MFRMRTVLLSVLLVIGVLLLTVRPAAAQGTSGQLPDPIATVELNRLLNLYVKPDDSQRATIESLHDDYRAQFRTLREAEIEKFLEEMNKIGGRGIPSKSELLDFARRYEQVNAKIAALDNGLFDAIATLVGEQRAPDVRRARDARARSRYATGMLGSMPGAMGNRADVSAMVLELGLPAEELAPFQPELIALEERLTSLARESSTAGVKGMIDMVEAIEKAGLGDMSEEAMAQDPEKMQAAMEVMQESMAKAFKPMAERAARMAEMNTKTFRSVRERLTGDARRKLHGRFVGGAYPELAGDFMGVEPILRAVLRIRALDDGAREQVEQTYRTWMQADEAITDRGMAILDEGRASWNPMDFSGMSGSYEKLQEIQTERGELGTRTLESLKTMVGEERITKLIERRLSQDEMFTSTEDPEAVADADAEDPSVAVRASESEPIEAAPIEAMASPIKTSTIQALLSRLDAAGLSDPGLRPTIETMHADYLRTWTEEVEPIRAKLNEFMSKIWTWDGESGRASVNTAARDGYHTSRREADAKIRSLDDALFLGMVSVAGEGAEAEIAVVRFDRLTEGSAVGADPFIGAFGRQASPVSLMQALVDAELGAEDRAAVLKALSPKLSEFEPQIRAVRTEQLEIDREMQIVQEESQAIYGSGETPDAAAMTRMQQRWMEVQGRSMRLGERRAETIRGAWSALFDALGAASRDRLSFAFERQAYPDVFQDARSALPFLERAEDMHDLSEAQRAELSALHARYREEYFAYCRSMVPKAESSAPPPTDGEAAQEMWRKRMAEENEKAKVRFDRDERSQRAVSQLRRILTPEQAARIPGLGSYDKEASKSDSPFGVPVN
jgi:hypothetical protein